MSASSGRSTRAPSETPTESAEQMGQTNWEKVDQAVRSLEDLDIVEMASHIVTQARIKGPKEAFNEAGSVRYQLAKVRQHVAYLQQTICSESLEAQHLKIRALKRGNAQKRILTGQKENEQST